MKNLSRGFASNTIAACTSGFDEANSSG